MRKTALLMFALLAAPVAAQSPAGPGTYDRAIAAGYKALTMCSAMELGHRTPAQIASLELDGIYPEYDRLVAALPFEGPSDTNPTNRTAARAQAASDNAPA